MEHESSATELPRRRLTIIWIAVLAGTVIVMPTAARALDQSTANERLRQALEAKELDKALAIYEDEPVVNQLTELARALQRDGRGDVVLRLFESYMLTTDEPAESPDPAVLTGPLYEVAGVLVHVGEAEAFIAKLKAALAQRPGDRHLYRCALALLSRTQRHAQAVEMYESYLARVDQPSAGQLMHLGQFAERAKQTDEAIAGYRRALSAKVSDQDLRTGRVSCIARSREQMEQDLLARIRHALAGIFIEQEQWAEAERALLPLLDSSTVPTGTTARLLARIWQTMAKPNLIVQKLAEQVAESPDDAELRLRYAEALVVFDETELAIEQYRVAMDLAPTKLSIRLQFANLLARQKQANAALDEFKQVLDALLSDPDVDVSLGARGRGRVTVGQVISAMTRFAEHAKHEEAVASVFAATLDHVAQGPAKQIPDRSLRQMIRLIAKVKQSKSDHRGIIELWLTWRQQLPAYAYEEIGQAAQQLSDLSDLIKQLQSETEQHPDEIAGRAILARLLQLSARHTEALTIYHELDRSLPPDHRLRNSVRELRRERQAPPEPQPVVRDAPSANEVEVMRARAQALIDSRRGDDATRQALLEAADLYRRIIDKRPTDVASMVALGRTLVRLGDDQSAVKAFEKAHTMRRWSSGDHGAAGELQRLYEKLGQDDKLIEMALERNDYSDLRSLLTRRGELDRYHTILLEQVRQRPDNFNVKWYLANSFIARQQPDEARQIYNRRREQLMTSDTLQREPLSAVSIARGYDKIGDLEAAVTMLEMIDYPRTPDSNDWIGELLMRLQARTGRFDQSLQTCVHRLVHHSRKAATIGQEIAVFAEEVDGGPTALDELVEQLAGEIPDITRNTFVGAISAYRATRPQQGPAKKGRPTGPQLVELLRAGRPVRPPQNVRNLELWLRELASRADTVAEGTFLDMTARHAPAPDLPDEPRAALELLAEAVTGLGAALEIPRNGPSAGYWCLNQSGDPARSSHLAASGGLISRIGFYSRRDRAGRIWTLPDFMFDPQLQDAIIAVTASPKVLKAVDAQGRDLAVADVPTTRWGPPDGGHMQLSLRKLDPPSHRVARVRVRYRCAVQTREAHIQLDGLDHDQIVELASGDTKVRVHPLDTKSKPDHWRLTVEVKRQLHALQGAGSLRSTARLVTSQNQLVRISGWSATEGLHESVRAYRMARDSFDPSTTRLIIIEPAAIEVVPVELTFRNVPITHID